MAGFPAKKNAAYVMYISLPDLANAGLMKSTPTLAAGDFKVSIDGGSLTNLTTLPTNTPASSKMVKISLSASEMNGDNITVVCSDAAGAEWGDVVIDIHTTARQIDDLAFPTTSGRSIDVTAGGAVGIDWANVESPTTTVGLTGTTISTSQAVASVSGAVGSVTGAVGSVTGNVGGNVVGSVASVTGGINTGAGVITTLDALDTAQDSQHATTQGKVDTAQADLDILTGADGVVIASGTQTFNMTGSITGNLSGSVGSVTGAVGSVTGAVGSVTATVSADVVSVSGDATAADNLELMFDGTGYTDDTAPASRAQVNNIGSGSGGSLNYANEADNIDSAIKSVSFVGVETSGTNASVNAEDGIYHQIDDTGNAIDIVYQFDVGGGRTASSVTWHGYLSGSNDTITVQAYNGSGWDTIKSIAGQAATTNVSEVIPLLSTHTGTGADLGLVFIRFVCSSQSNPTLYTDQLIVQAVNIGQSVGYADGAIWVDTNNGTAGTEAFVNGTADNPVSTWANALTLSSTLGINRFRVAGASSITLTASSANYQIIGNGLFTLALGGQSVANAKIINANISGTSSGSGCIFEDCRINDSTSTGPSYFVRCGFDVDSGTPYTANGAGEYAFVDCVSLVAANVQPYFDFSGTGSTTAVNFRRWSGGMNATLDSNADSSFDIVSGGTVTITTGGADVGIRGTCKAVNFAISASENVEFVGVTGHVTVSGTATAATVTLSGVATDITNTSTGSTVNDNTVSIPTVSSSILTTQLTEAYAADGVAPTLAQAIFMTMQSLSEFAISGTTITVKKLDGSTTAATYTLDDATSPTSRTRAT